MLLIFVMFSCWNSPVFQNVKLAASFGPRHEKTCLRGSRPSKAESSLLSYND